MARGPTEEDPRTCPWPRSREGPSTADPACLPHNDPEDKERHPIMTLLAVKGSRTWSRISVSSQTPCEGGGTWPAEGRHGPGSHSGKRQSWGPAGPGSPQPPLPPAERPLCLLASWQCPPRGRNRSSRGAERGAGGRAKGLLGCAWARRTAPQNGWAGPAGGPESTPSSPTLVSWTPRKRGAGQASPKRPRESAGEGREGDEQDSPRRPRIGSPHRPGE